MFTVKSITLLVQWNFWDKTHWNESQISVYLWNFRASFSNILAYTCHLWLFEARYCFRRTSVRCTSVLDLPRTPSFPQSVALPAFLFFIILYLPLLHYLIFRLRSSVSIPSSFSTLYILHLTWTYIYNDHIFSSFISTSFPPNYLRIYSHPTAHFNTIHKFTLLCQFASTRVLPNLGVHQNALKQFASFSLGACGWPNRAECGIFEVMQAFMFLFLISDQLRTYLLTSNS